MRYVGLVVKWGVGDENESWLWFLWWKRCDKKGPGERKWELVADKGLALRTRRIDELSDAKER